MTIIYSKNYSFRKKWELFIQKIIQLQKNHSTKYSFNKFENYSFKKIIHFFEKLIIAQGYARDTLGQVQLKNQHKDIRFNHTKALLFFLSDTFGSKFPSWGM